MFRSSVGLYGCATPLVNIQGTHALTSMLRSRYVHTRLENMNLGLSTTRWSQVGVHRTGTSAVIHRVSSKFPAIRDRRTDTPAQHSFQSTAAYPQKNSTTSIFLWLVVLAHLHLHKLSCTVLDASASSSRYIVYKSQAGGERARGRTALAEVLDSRV